MQAAVWCPVHVEVTKTTRCSGTIPVGITSYFQNIMAMCLELVLDMVLFLHIIYDHLDVGSSLHLNNHAPFYESVAGLHS